MSIPYLIGALGLAAAVAFVQPASNQAATPSAAAIPAPRDEHWIARHQAIVDSARQGGFELAFLGDSITEGWASSGKDAWAKQYSPRRAINLGIGGDRTQHVLWRLDHDLLEALAQLGNDAKGVKPNNIRAIVLMIGTNNSNGSDHTAEQIAEGITAIVGKLRSKLPRAKILMLGIFPRGEKPNPQREKNARASQLASKIADGKSIHYLDIGEKFLAADGTLPPEIMPDFLHLSPKGYDIWAQAIDEKLKELLGEVNSREPTP